MEKLPSLQCLSSQSKCLFSVLTAHFLFLCIPAGRVVRHLSLSLFGSSLLGSEEHAGFLYVRSTLQSLQGLPLPNQPYLFGLLVHRAEVPWARAFPLRLMLRLGAEYRCKQDSLTKCSICTGRDFLFSCPLCFLFQFTRVLCTVYALGSHCLGK